MTKKNLDLILCGICAGIVLLNIILWLHFTNVAFAAVAVHEFGHAFGLLHCPERYCIMNREHTPLSYAEKLLYGLEYCLDCKKKILENTESGIKPRSIGNKRPLHGLIVAYHASADPERVAEIVQEKLAFIPVYVDYFQIPDNEKVLTGPYGEVVARDLLRVLNKYGIDVSKYENPVTRTYLICEINDPPSTALDKWGSSWPPVMYAYPPVKFYIQIITFTSLVSITGCLIYLLLCKRAD